MSHTTFLDGNKVHLRPLSSTDDLSAYERWVNDQETVLHMGVGRFPQTTALLKNYIESYNASHNFLLGIFLKENNAHIGNITLHMIDRQNQNAEIGILLGEKQYRGKGLGLEAVNLVVQHAFMRLNLHKVTTGMVVGNVASVKLFEKAGFKLEGRIREQFYLNGKFEDCLRYGLLRSEYPSK